MTAAARPGLLGAVMGAARRIVEVRKRLVPERHLEAAARARRPRGDLFVERLARPGSPNVIAECKRRSPSQGVLRTEYDAASLAAGYERHGAAAISVLTEPAFFDGSLDDLRAVSGQVSVPVLRKDFIVDEYQLLEAKAAGADAALLIVAALEPGRLRALIAASRELGLAALVEAHDEAEIEAAAAAGARVVGVNNRSLETLEVDLSRADRLIDLVPDEVVAVAESGLRAPGDLRRLRERGYDAFLVGERLVTAPDPGRALGELLTCS